MEKLINQIIYFIFTSGIGFLMDFSVYYFLSTYVGVQVSYANMISSIPAITYVFIVASKKVFKGYESRYPLYIKYIMYFIYQIILVVCVSILAQIIFNNFYYIVYSFINESVFKVIIKCLITPITMMCNFFVMKFLCEKM